MKNLNNKIIWFLFLAWFITGYFGHMLWVTFEKQGVVPQVSFVSTSNKPFQDPDDIFEQGVLQTISWERYNRATVGALLKDSTVGYYFLKSGKPPILYLHFNKSDAITTEDMIFINTGKAYSKEEMKGILIKQFGCYFGFNWGGN